jgi:antitoxin component YwqK of YwqJK toxin-antitoxin module
VQRTYFESGTLREESTFKLGRIDGPHRSWWPNGQQAALEQYVAGRRTMSKRWSESGQVTRDEHYEADGSRMLAR